MATGNTEIDMMAAFATAEDDEHRSEFKTRRSTKRWTNNRVDKYAFTTSSPITGDVLSGYGGIRPVGRKYNPEVIRRARRRRLNRLRTDPRILRAAFLGTLSLFLYTLLFQNEQAVLELSVGRWWSFLIPVSIALTFSFVHGAFTGAFWDAVGLKPHTVRK